MEKTTDRLRHNPFWAKLQVHHHHPFIANLHARRQTHATIIFRPVVV